MIAKQRKLLLELRSDLVGKLHTQPFTIYNDATIELLLKAQPKTKEELGKVKGFPPDGKRMKGFGDAVIAIFTKTDIIDKISINGDENGVSVSPVLKSMDVF